MQRCPRTYRLNRRFEASLEVEIDVNGKGARERPLDEIVA